MDLLVLVNKDFKFDEDINCDLVHVPKNISTGSYMLNKEALEAFIKFRDYFINKGIEVLIDGGYRSYEYQRQIYDRFVSDKGRCYADMVVSPVGCSEHHTGLAIDLTLKINDKILEDNDDLLDHKSIFKLIEKDLYKFGFILRYPEDELSVKITGYPYEPWHIRYIGRDNAFLYKNSGVKTLEEYLKPNLYFRDS